jgi:hypothetical protein
MVRRITLRPRKATRRHYVSARDFLAAVRARKNSKTRQQHLALYEERASQRLPLFDE